MAHPRLQLPESAQRQSGLTHFTMFWEAYGHPPAPYLTPHFDFHFYTIPSAERAAIDCADTTPTRWAAGAAPIAPPLRVPQARDTAGWIKVAVTAGG